MLIYPALNLNPFPSPSRAMHMNDPLVPHRLLTLLANAYAPDGEISPSKPCNNPYMSPWLATDDLLRRFPHTDILVGGLDPLLDDAIDFNTRLRRVGVGGELCVYRGLPHGFLNFQFLPGAQEAVESARGYISSVLKEEFGAGGALLM